MVSISSQDVAARWPQLLALVIGQGEEVSITEAGEAVARIVPVAAAPPPLTDGAWQAEREAWKRDAAGRADRYPPGSTLDDGREGMYREREDAQR